MIDNQNECLYPPTANCTLWRYMDLTKLLSLLETETLFFPRADSFEDPYEGTWSRIGVELMRRQNLAAEFPPEISDHALQLMEQMRREMFISCWNIGEHESAAMWKLYLQSPEGIAIKTDYETFTTSLTASPLNIRTTKVKYVDYESTYITFGNVFSPFTHKRLSFAHENELRAMIWSVEDINKTQLGSNPESVKIKISTQQLIKAIHVSPTAPKWFGSLVQDLLKRYGINCPVEHSTLYERPTY
jgi:hypothetical protein